MKILTWAVRLLIFLLLFAFAVQNTEPVSLHFVFGQGWQAPLVMVLLAFFAAGALLGILSIIGIVFRQRRVIASLRREIGKPQSPVGAELPPTQ